MLLPRESLDYDQPSSAARTRECEHARLFICIPVGAVIVVCFGPIRFWEQLSDCGDICGAIAIAQEAVVANAVLALWQHVDQKPTHEFMGGEGHGFMACGTVDPVILVSEGNALIAHADQTAVGDGDTVGIS